MSESEPWYAGFDTVDFETTPVSERPEDDGFHLICPVEGCDHEAEFEHLGEIADSDWSGMSRKDQILTDGTTLKEAYCPAHSLNETGTAASDNIGSGFEQFISNLQKELGTPLDTHENPEPPEHTKDEYAEYDFADGEVMLSGTLLVCGHESCHREQDVDAVEQAEDAGWVSGQMVDILADGRMLFNGRCPEHQE